jgi:hypothetical protein
METLDELMTALTKIRNKWLMSGNLVRGGKITMKFIAPNKRALLSCAVTPPGASLTKHATFLLTDVEKLEEWLDLMSKQYWQDDGSA